MEKNKILHNGMDNYDIAKFICEMAKIKNNDDIRDIENALFHIEAIAENNFNCDYWRTFYNSLLIIAENY